MKILIMKKVIIPGIIITLLSSCAVNIDPSIINTPVGRQIISAEFITVIIGLVIGGICIIAGFILSILGVSGSVEWFLKAQSITAKLVNASPGVVLTIVGLIIVLRNRLKIKSTKKKPK